MSSALDIDDAFYALIRERIPALADVVYPGELLNPDGSRMTSTQQPEMYVLVHANRGLVRPDRFTGPARRRRKTYWTHSVGLTKRQAEKISERVLEAVLNARLVVDGWICDPILHEASQPVQTDLSSKPARYFAVDNFDLYASPAP